METLDETMEKQRTFAFVWQLLLPKIAPQNRNLEDACRKYWNTLTLAKQRQIYYCLREQIRNGEPVKDNPLFAIQDCTPVPCNWNGRQGVNEMMKRTKMVIAKYKPSAKYGTYTLQEAMLFEMTDIKPLNY